MYADRDGAQEIVLLFTPEGEAITFIKDSGKGGAFDPWLERECPGRVR
jgi:hypothetical protein